MVSVETPASSARLRMLSPRAVTRRARQLDALENIVRELEQLLVLKEYELGVRLEYAPEGSGPSVPVEK